MLAGCSIEEQANPLAIKECFVTCPQSRQEPSKDWARRLLWLFAVAIAQPALAAPQAEHVVAGALYIDSPTGRRHYAGIVEAFERHPFGQEHVSLKPYRYVDSLQGFDTLRRIIEDEEVDVVLGPTESDVFVRGVEMSEIVSEHRIPVVSGLVTADGEGNTPEGWFFRINADVVRRTNTMWCALNRHWISTIGVLYADTEFGRRAKRAFEQNFNARTRPGRLTQLVIKNPSRPEPEIDRLLELRPEAVGFFGEREQIAQLYTELRMRHHSAIPYNPLVFTILDARLIANQTDDIWFVSLVDGDLTFTITDDLILKLREQEASPEFCDAVEALRGRSFQGAPALLSQLPTENSEQLSRERSWLLRHASIDTTEDDVKALGFDLGLLVLQELQKLGPEPLDAQRRTALRNRLARVMTSTGRVDCPIPYLDFKTEPQFANLSNNAPPRVFRSEHLHIHPVPVTDHVGWWAKVGQKADLVLAVHGWIVYLSLFVAFTIACSISLMDLRRLFPRKHVKIFRTRIIFVYILGHFSVVLVLYVFLAETGRISYGDLLMVLIISMTPSAFLRTTFFETRQGQAIGLEGIYKRMMGTIDRSIMRARYGALEALSNVIAYNNSEDTLRSALVEVYRNHPSTVQRAHLIQKLEERMASEPQYLNRRRAAAELLMREFSLEELKGEGLAPTNWSYEEPFDPRLLIRKAARNCNMNDELAEKIDDLLKAELAKLQQRSASRYDDLVKFMNAELDTIYAAEGALIVKLRILLVLVGFDLKWFEENQFLTKQDIEAERERLRRAMEARSPWWIRLTRRRDSSREQEAQESTVEEPSNAAIPNETRE